MHNRSYEELLEHLTRTDLLAVERTKLANKRTLLSYIRTSFSLLIASVGIIEFFENSFFITVGFILMPISFTFLIIGIIRFSQSQKTIDKIIDYKEDEKN